MCSWNLCGWWGVEGAGWGDGQVWNMGGVAGWGVQVCVKRVGDDGSRISGTGVSLGKKGAKQGGENCVQGVWRSSRMDSACTCVQ